jgi:hypothetical protein
MNDETPLIASSPPTDGDRAGWRCTLAPDERLPEQERGWWAIDPDYLAAYAKCDRDPEMSHEQVIWTAEVHAKVGNLLLGPAEDGLWPIMFPDGSTDYAYVVNFWNDEDLRRETNRIIHDDLRLHGHTRPHDPDAGRWAGTPAYDEFGRKRTGRAEFL